MKHWRMYAPDTGAEGTQNATEPQEGKGQPEGIATPPEAKQTPQGRTYTDAEVDAIVAKKLAKAKAEREEAERVAKMTAEEQAAHRIQQLESELATMQAERLHAEQCATARSVLQAAGVPVIDAIAEKLTGENEAETRSRAEFFAKAFAEAVEAGVAERLKGKTPNRTTTQPQGVTREEIEAEKDPVRRVQLIAEHPELFN